MDKQVDLAQDPALEPEERERQLKGEKLDQDDGRDYTRSTYLIDQDFQYRFATTWIASVLLYVGLICLCFYWAAGVVKTSTHQAQITAVVADVSLYVSVFVILLTILFGIYFLLLSHRISGPAYRLTESLKRIARGDFNFKIRLRQSDYLQSVADRLNSVLESLRQRNESIEHIESRLADLQDDLEQLEEIDENADLVDECDEIQDQLRSIRTPDDQNQASQSSDEE